MGLTVEIKYGEALGLRDPVFIDVRSPSEFRADHIPGAVNMPVFDDEERAVIGTLYRSVGETAAVLRGTEIAGVRVPAFFGFVREAEGRDIVFYCARGGMRSTALVSLLRALGRGVYKLSGGYKEYRRYVRQRMETLEISAKVYALHGLAGTGKTAIVRKIANGIDLEEMAGHRSSVFGALGRTPSTQKFFESLLLRRLDGLGSARWAVLEGESRLIGHIHIPARLVRVMEKAPAIVVEASLEQRVRNILDDYGRDFSMPEVMGLLDSIGNRIGKKNMEMMKELLQKGNLEDFVSMLLQRYYDPLYMYTLKDVDVAARLGFAGAERTAIEVEGLIGELLGQKNEINTLHD